MDAILQGNVDDFMKQYDLHLAEDQLFETFSIFCLVSRLHEAHFQPDPFRVGGGGDQGIDGFAILINGELCNDPAQIVDAIKLVAQPRIQVVVLQAKTTPEFESKVFTELADTIDHVFTAERLRANCSAKIRHVRACVEALYGDRLRLAGRLPTVYVWYVTPGKPSVRRLEPKRSEAQARLSNLTGEFSSVHVEAIGGAELRQYFKRATEALSAMLRIPKQRRVELPTTPGVGKGIFGLVSARELVANLLRDDSNTLRTVLFDDNVRDFLGYAPTTSVNAHIRATLEDKDQQHRFAVLNNGVTIVAKSVELVKDCVVVKDPRIVNGCQTSNALFDAFSKLGDDVEVPVRIFQCEDEVVEAIVVATNRQTAINVNDLEIRGNVHREIEQFFAAQPPARRLYYERRPGQYRRGGIVQTRVVNRADVARAYAASFLGESWRLWRLSDLMEARRHELFQADTDTFLYYIAASIHYQLEWLFRNRPEKFGEFRAARFVMMRALSLRLVGSRGLPTGRQDREAACVAARDQLWADSGPELLVDAIMPALRAAVDRVAVNGSSLSDAVRSQEFAEDVCSLLGLDSSA